MTKKFPFIKISFPNGAPDMGLGPNDMDMKEKQAINVDYSNTGFDRGHLNPNFYQCNNGRTATFTLTNAVPQNPCFNQQIWKAMEEQSKKFMHDSCHFPGAKRFFVTGAVPTAKKIPDEIHDREGDRSRDYNRVSVPSHMWTAACCDTTSCPDPNDRKKGFSFGYIGNNTADPYVERVSVRKLEQTLMKKYRFVDDVFFKGEIFGANDKCNINKTKSEEILQKLAVGLAIRIGNEVRTISKFETNVHPLKRRMTAMCVEAVRDSKYPKLSDVVTVNPTLSNVEYNLNLKSQEVVKTRTELLSVGLSLILIQPCLNPSSSSAKHNDLKRTVDKNVCEQTSVYNVVRKQSEAGDVTLDGTHCRHGHKCDRHGEDYSWCYTDWRDNWDYCCENDCTFRGESYMWCRTGASKKSWSYCSQRSSMITITGKRCLQEHECGLHGESDYWCYIDLTKKREYCCQPWHPCGYHGEKYKWCYCGRSKETTWQYCT